MNRDNALALEVQLAQLRAVTRRHFLAKCSTGLGALWFSGLTKDQKRAQAANVQSEGGAALSTTRAPHFRPTAKRVIYLHMAGAPSQLELFDHKPLLAQLDGKDCPAEFLKGKRFAFIQGVPKLLGPQYPFRQAGQSGAWVSDRLPHFAEVVDEVCFIKSMWTDQFNHAPAQLLLHTGNPNLGHPSIGAWTTYGLGTENENLPGFIVLASGGRTPSAGKSVWGAGFLPSVYQGVQCRSKGEPVLFLSNPSGITMDLRRQALNAMEEINRQTYQELGDPETLTRIAQYETAFRMQTHASTAFDLADEPENVLQEYGAKPGVESFANNCLLARRLAERGVRYIQLFHWGWDSHGSNQREALDIGFVERCNDVDQAMAALITDLKQRGLLDDTLVVWGGEFGRTPMRENRGGIEMKYVGRDHNPGAFTIWMAGGGVRAGLTYGQTDPLGYEAAVDRVSIQDLQATLLHCLGIDHDRLTFPFQGLAQRLTGVTKPSRVIEEILA